MGLAWSSPGAESSECIDTRVCPAAMHARCLAWARLDHWSPVAWYRALNPDGTVQDRTPCHPPLCVVPRSDGTYHLIDRWAAREDPAQDRESNSRTSPSPQCFPRVAGRPRRTCGGRARRTALLSQHPVRRSMHMHRARAPRRQPQ